MENRLRLLFSLQRVDAGLDELHEMKGDLPDIVDNLTRQLKEKEVAKTTLETTIKQDIVRRDDCDLEVISTKELIEKYKTQQFQVKTNKQYDALTREIEAAQDKVNRLEKDMEMLEGKIVVAKHDVEAISPQVQELQRELSDRTRDLEHIQKEHEEEELKLQHERDKIAARIAKSDLSLYDRIRRAKNGSAVVQVRRNACGGCYKRVPPQIALELRKNARVLTCEHCGRILVSDEIVESAKAET